jgi:hypothetical protein
MRPANIISIILLVIYSVSTIVGIGIIRCGCTHSQRLVMMYLHPSCLCRASNDDCCQHNSQHHDEQNQNCEPGYHEKDCCTFVLKHVDIDHLNVTQYNDHPTKIITLLFSPLVSVDVLMDSIKEYAGFIKNNSPSAVILKIPLIYAYSQLLL